MPQVHLPFWSFFKEIETALSYERWIDKYENFLQVISSPELSYEKDQKTFISFCKALYLQDIRDEKKFVALLTAAIEREKVWIRGEIRRSQPNPETQKTPEPDTETVKNENDQKTQNKATKNNDTPDLSSDTDEGQDETETTRPAAPEYVSGSYQLSFDQPDRTEISSAQKEPLNYLQTDEYLPVSRRQMVKGWQFLRRKETGGRSDELDINGTIRQIAKDGTFITPKYHPGTKNREDAIIILADYRGSMVAFHEMTDRLIQSAKVGGGHPNVPVYYFHNFPVGHVYRNQNMTDPVDLHAALRHANRNFTLAFVISDAGAARGRDAAGAETRFRNTGFLLEKLNNSCAHTIWLNPMPAHRWKNTTAELISEEVFLMSPLMESNSYNFQDMMRTILKQKLTITE
ncbi:MAG: hypothetical protein ABW036_09770 [Flavitalea sp.]